MLQHQQQLFEVKRCSTCKIEKTLDNFHKDRTRKDGLRNYCKKCSSKHSTKWQQNNRKRYNKSMVERRKKSWDKIFEMFGGRRCSVCGIESEYPIYDLHHKDPKEKDVAVGSLLLGSWKKIKAEAEKCVLLCSNCHRIAHAKERQKVKTVNTLVSDIYNLVSTKEVPEDVDIDACIEQFGEKVKSLMRQEFTEKRDDTRKLRMSNIGRGERFLWNVVNDVEKGEDIQPHTYVKFLYGHVIEELLLFLTRAAGHEVTDEQKKCEVNGIKGSMDCKINGVVTDVKSASTYGFKKFRDGTLAYDDPFGYVAQIKGYAASEGETKYGWLAMDKQNGHLAYLLYDEEDTQAPVRNLINYDMGEHVDRIKETVEQTEPPEVCYEPVADGKAGNQKLAVGCSYCAYKKACWPGLRAFLYSTGPRFLVEVKNEPKVQEIEVS